MVAKKLQNHTELYDSLSESSFRHKINCCNKQPIEFMSTNLIRVETVLLIFFDGQLIKFVPVTVTDKNRFCASPNVCELNVYLE